MFFDLDGTLTDSRDGITRCIEYALEQLGARVPALDALRQYVGPPLPGSFATLLNTSDPEPVERAIAAYRERFERIGMFENRLYPGTSDALNDLVADGRRLCLVTAKPRVYARRILEHFGLLALFREVYGPELASRDYTKTSLIAAACAGEHADPRLSMMIGDRGEDVLGARENGLLSIAVNWGYSEPGELEVSAPDRIVTSTRELVEYIRHAADMTTHTTRR